MHDYNQYVTAVNKIFDYIAKIKAGWDNQDSMNYIETIEAFQNVVTGSANEFKKPPGRVVDNEEETPQEETPQPAAVPMTTQAEAPAAPAQPAPAAEQPATPPVQSLAEDVPQNTQMAAETGATSVVVPQQ